MKKNGSRRIVHSIARSFAFGLAASCAMTSAAMAAAPTRGSAPNIVFILADDMGYGDLSSFGQRHFSTPAIDSIAAEGVAATQAYAPSPICSSSRTALLTGKYNGRFVAGLDEPHNEFTDRNQLPTDTPTIATALKEAGYYTALVGKWHVGRIPDHSPLRFGYDYFYGMADGAADYFDHTFVPGDKKPESGLWDNDKPVVRLGYLTDIIADKAIEQIDEDHKKPFFLSVHFNAPHWPWEGPQDNAWPRMLEKTGRALPYGGSVEKYAEMMESLDRNVGRILAALAARNLDSNTIVIFTSDNGGERYSDTWPLIGYKAELLEGGMRVPFLMKWPGHVPAHSRTTQVISLFDLVPTLQAVAGASGGTWDGQNVLPQLEGKAPDMPRTLFWRFNAMKQQAVRSGDWKYINIDGKEGLFDLKIDPRERTDVKREHPKLVESLKAAWQHWNAGMEPYTPEDYPGSSRDVYMDRF